MITLGSLTNHVTHKRWADTDRFAHNTLTDTSGRDRTHTPIYRSAQDTSDTRPDTGRVRPLVRMDQWSDRSTSCVTRPQLSIMSIIDDCESLLPNAQNCSVIVHKHSKPSAVVESREPLERCEGRNRCMTGNG